MRSSHIDRLSRCLDKSISASQPELRPILGRISEESRQRSLHTGFADYFVSLSRALCRIRGAANADLRVQCLYDCVRYLAGSGELKKALELSGPFIQLASMSGDANWVRKSRMV